MTDQLLNAIVDFVQGIAILTLAWNVYLINTNTAGAKE